MYRTFIPYILFLAICIAWNTSVSAQETWFMVRADSLAKDIPALESKVDISVSNVSIQEFLRAIARSSGLNLNVDPEINENVVNNFSDVKVRDMLIFLERNYPIDVEVIGNIINIRKRVVVETIETDFKGVHYDSLTHMITLDYYQADLNQVAREITRVTEYNVILAPSISDLKVNGYVEDMPFKGAMEQFAFSNNLTVRVTGVGYYVLEPNPQKEQMAEASNGQNPRNRSQKAKQEEYYLNVKRLNSGEVLIHSVNAPLENIISEVGDEMKVNYYISTQMEGTVSLQSEVANFGSFLEDALKGSAYLFQEEGGIYVVGSKEASSLKHVQAFQFQNRTLDKVTELLPEDVKLELSITDFPDLNSLLICGEESRIRNLTDLLISIDKTVPVILIEVIIVNVSKNYTISTGIEAGIGDAPVQTQGTVFPSIDMTIGAEEINKAINGFSGFGVLNLGGVNPNFYVMLKAMEQQGILDVSSTPKLSTLNGHEATMNIGNTEYYLEETSNYIGTQNPSLSTSQVYKSVKAELAVSIRPIVSGDDQITLDIIVEQSDFTERISKNAPPGSVNRKFESLIRVKNQETIILGGLEEKRYQDSSSGTPFLSRIPVIKWLFSSRTRQDQKSKLSIFIKPTIIG